LGYRLADEAERLRQKARTVPAGNRASAFCGKAGQLETASQINEWLSSPGLQTPQVNVPAPRRGCLEQTSIRCESAQADPERYDD